MSEHFDVIVVGAGPSGNAAAYTVAKAGLKVLQLERGESPGSKNVQGAILYADALEKIIPEFREDAPPGRSCSKNAGSWAAARPGRQESPGATGCRPNGSFTRLAPSGATASTERMSCSRAAIEAAFPCPPRNPHAR